MADKARARLPLPPSPGPRARRTFMREFSGRVAVQ